MKAVFSKLSKFVSVWFFGLILLFLIFTRFFNLSHSGTFFWDQAYDLNKIHQYFQDKTVTLVGPISEDGNKVYGSLTYYMLMPFAVIFNFSTISTTLGAAFYGLLSAILIILLAKKVNSSKIVLISLLTIVWFPLIETSRWAWNPNLVILWIALGLLFFLQGNGIFLFLSGLFFGLSIHHHYLAIVAPITFLFLSLFSKRTLLKKLYPFLGVAASILPFVLFDLRHPPGLFLSRILYFNQSSGPISFIGIVLGLKNNLFVILNYYTNSLFFSWLLLLVIVSLLIFDVYKFRSKLLYFLPWLAQLIAITFINANYPHYFLGSLVFFILWLSAKRHGIANAIANIGILLLIASSLITIIPQLETNPYTKKEWQPNITTIDKINSIIKDASIGLNPDLMNIAVLGSTDSNTYGWKYRSLLAIQKINFLPRENYNGSQSLFVVSQASQSSLLKDPALELDSFRNAKTINSYPVTGTNWLVYLLIK